MTRISLTHMLRVIAICLVGLAFSVPAHAAEYVVDTEGMHAAIQFRVSHLGYSVLTGRFNDFEGGFTWDKENPGASRINITIDTNSLDTNHAERDKHVRAEEFLYVDKYPVATFKSTKYSGDASGGKLEGELTLRGVTRPVTLDVDFIGEGPDPWGGYRAGFSATTTLKFKDFGIETPKLGPAKEIDFDLFIEGVRK